MKPNTKAIEDFFQDPDASSVVTTMAVQIAAPVVQGANIRPEELMMGGGLRVVVLVIDRSPSMTDVGPMLLSDFKAEFVPALREAREDDISVLRFGCVTFSSDITQVWNRGGQYFHTLEDLPDLTKAEYDPDRGYGTNMDEAIEFATALGIRYAAEQQALIGMAPDVDIIILGDGADTHRSDHSPVKRMIQSRNAGRVRYVHFYFETQLGLKDPKKELVSEYGYDGENVVIFAQKPNESPKERRSRFRAMVRVMSRVSASKGTSGVNAAAAQATASSTDEEELV